MKYKVIPFVGSLAQNTKSPNQGVAEQLEEIITKHSSVGWEYVRLESVSTWVTADNGCFGIGAKPGYPTSRQMIVFKREE